MMEIVKEQVKVFRPDASGALKLRETVSVAYDLDGRNEGTQTKRKKRWRKWR